MFQKEPSESLHNIAESVLKLSDFYIANPDAETPWDQSFCQTAYRNYYFPLNFLRNQKIIQRGKQNDFFAHLTHFIDWGAGPGTASLALAYELKPQIKKQILVDRSKTVLKAFADIQQPLVKLETSTELKLGTYLDQKQHSCLVFSYSMTEIDELPSGWDQFEALMILEPSTSQDGRKLLELRQKLIEKGFSIWAPCTHQLNCPLLKESNHDWCHDRIVVDAPDWFWDLDQKLPMKNKTITTSYLLAHKKKSPEFAKNIARLTGDSREEKGKTRQLICRGEKREFLTWMHKQTTPQVFPRGELVRLPELIEEKSNELRVQSECELVFNTTS
jgi:hypothetical protein